MKSMLRLVVISATVIAGAASAKTRSEELTAPAAIGFLKLNPDEVNTTRATWNGQQTIFVDYLLGDPAYENPEIHDRWVVAVQRDGLGQLHATRVDIGEHEGGDPDLAAIGFANADADKAKELIVIFKWPVQHYDVGGSLYEVRLFDDLKPGQTELSPLPKVSGQFGMACDCDRIDGTKERFRFKTISAVRQELNRLGY